MRIYRKHNTYECLCGIYCFGRICILTIPVESFPQTFTKFSFVVLAVFHLQESKYTNCHLDYEDRQKNDSVLKLKQTVNNNDNQRWKRDIFLFQQIILNFELFFMVFQIEHLIVNYLKVESLEDINKYNLTVVSMHVLSLIAPQHPKKAVMKTTAPITIVRTGATPNSVGTPSADTFCK